MSSESGRRRTLAVCANGTGNHVVVSREGSTWAVASYSSLEQIIELARAGMLDAVALPFDVMASESTDNFLTLAEAQTDQRPLLVSYSRFNPDWIENLVASLGVSVHMRGELDLPVLFDALDEHLQDNTDADIGTEALT